MGKVIPKWHRRLLVAAALVFLVLSPGRTQTWNVAPQPLGALVDVGGYRVHLYCVGSGSPTVLITGAGYSFDWGLVQPEVAKFTRVCAYDHSGIAWSDPGPTDSCSVRVGEIHSALRNAKITGPYVLVGHSLGAFVSRLNASKYPDEVTGMVIVDHAFDGRDPDLGLAAPPAPVATRADTDLAFQKLSARDYQLHLWANSLPGYSKIMERNRAMNPDCASEVEAASRNQTNPLDDKPLIVLSRYPIIPVLEPPRVSWSNPFNDRSPPKRVHSAELPPAYAKLLSKLLSLSSNSKQMVVEKSGHLSMIDRPDVVISAIREVVEAAQNHTKLKN